MNRPPITLSRRLPRAGEPVVVHAVERLKVDPFLDHETPPQFSIYPQESRIVEHTRLAPFTLDEWPSLFAVAGGAYTMGHSGSAVLDNEGHLIGILSNVDQTTARDPQLIHEERARFGPPVALELTYNAHHWPLAYGTTVACMGFSPWIQRWIRFSQAGPKPNIACASHDGYDVFSRLRMFRNP